MGKRSKNSSMHVVCGKTGTGNKLVKTYKYRYAGGKKSCKNHFFEGYFFHFYEDIPCNKEEKYIEKFERFYKAGKGLDTIEGAQEGNYTQKKST